MPFSNTVHLAPRIQYFYPLIIPENISVTSMGLLASKHRLYFATETSLSFGIYSLNGSTLVLKNSASLLATMIERTTVSSYTTHYYLTASNLSPYNLSPGNWWVCLLHSLTESFGTTTNTTSLGLPSDNTSGGWNSPTGLVAGLVSATTSSLRSTVNTSSLRQGTVTLGGQFMRVGIPHIILGA